MNVYRHVYCVFLRNFVLTVVVVEMLLKIFHDLYESKGAIEKSVTYDEYYYDNI